MVKAKTFLRKLEIRLTPYFLGNTLGIKSNLKWKRWAQDCKNNWHNLVSSDAKAVAKEIKRDGLAVIGKVSVDTLLKETTDYFGSESKLYQAMEQSSQAKLGLEIYHVLNQVKEPVEAYFGSHFRPFWISVQKTMPGKVDVASSFGWHTDDNPKEMIKIFVYLNDVKESNGAFRAFPWKTTKKLLAKGFRSFDEKQEREIING